MSFKFWSKFFFYSIVSFFTLIASINYIVNPYNIFNHTLFSTFIKTHEHTVSARMTDFYTLKHTDPTNLIMGSSRVGMFNQDIFQKYLGKNTYTLAMPGSNIEEQSQYLIFMIKNKKLKNILWSLDFFSFNPDLPNDDGFSYNRVDSSAFEKDDYQIALFSLQTTKNSLNTLVDNIELLFSGQEPKDDKLLLRESIDRYLTLSPEDIDKRTRIQLQYYPEKFLKFATFNKPESIQENLLKVKKIIDLCEEKNINLILYTSPVQKSFLDLYQTLGLGETFHSWKKELTKITDYTDFCTYNSVTDNPYNFVDGTHIMPNFGELIFAKIFHDPSVDVPSDFGTYVPKDSQRTP